MPTLRPAPHLRHADRDALVVIGIGLLAALVRLPILWQRSLSLDEVLSVKFAALEWPAFVAVMSGREANMLPYYLLLRGWLRVAQSDGAIRLLSVIWSVATVPLLYVVGTRFFGRRVGLVSAALLAVNAFDVRWAQQARSYSLVTCLTALATLWFADAVERQRATYWAGFTAASVIAVYGQFLAGSVLVAYAVALLVAPPREVPWRSVAVSAAAIGLLLLPASRFVLTRDVGQLDWVATSGLSSVRSLLFAFAGGSDGAGWLYVAACVTGLVTQRHRSSGRGSLESWHYGLTICWWIVPIALLLAVSYAKPMFVHRYLAMCLPPYLLLVALGITSIRSQRLRVLALAVVLLVSGYRVMHYYETFAGDTDWRSATRYVLERAQTGDALLFYIPAGQDCFEYYQRQLPSAPHAEVSIVPAELQGAALAMDDPAARYERLWLVVSHVSFDASTQLQHRLAAHYTAGEEQVFGGIRVTHYRRMDADPH
jgi:mannosyltransferase